MLEKTFNALKEEVKEAKEERPGIVKTPLKEQKEENIDGKLGIESTGSSLPNHHFNMVDECKRNLAEDLTDLPSLSEVKTAQKASIGTGTSYPVSSTITQDKATQPKHQNNPKPQPGNPHSHQTIPSKKPTTSPANRSQTPKKTTGYANSSSSHQESKNNVQKAPRGWQGQTPKK